MRRRIRDWIRVISPSEYLLILVLALAALIIGVGAIRSALDVRYAWDLSLAYLMLLVAAGTVVYAMLRVFRFHPVEYRSYGRWLADTPWRYPQPLPLGPVTLVWQDAVAVGVLALLFPPLFVSRLVVPVAFALVYSLTLAVTLCRVGTTWPAYATLTLIGCSILAAPVIWIQFPIAALAYAAAYLGMQQLLRRFPFTPEERKAYLPSDRNKLSPLTLVAGWPLPPVSVEKRSWRISHRHAAAIGAIVGWLLFCVGYHFQYAPGFDDAMRTAVIYAAVVSAALRIAIYIADYVPPISILGRIATGRLIIPGYDVVFVAPLIVLAAAWLIMRTGEAAGAPLILYAPFAAGTAMWLALALPPRRETWQLTGHHRIAYQFRAAFIEQGVSSKRH